MKKLVLTIAVVLGMTIGASAQQPFGDNDKGGLFGRGATPNYAGEDDGQQMPLLPAHGKTDNQNAPLGGGALLLIGFGAAYAMSKKKK